MTLKRISASVLLLLVMVLSLVSCKKELPEDAVYDPRLPETDAIVQEAGFILSQADFIFMHTNYLVELYYNTEDNQQIQLIQNFDKKPDKLKSQFNLIRNKDGNVMYVAEFQYPDSGRCENIYESVFSDKGDLILFVRQSSFTDGKMPVYEKSKYYFNDDQELIKKTYEMTYAGQTELPAGIKIDFKYRVPYKKIDTREDWLEEYGLVK